MHKIAGINRRNMSRTVSLSICLLVVMLTGSVLTGLDTHLLVSETLAQGPISTDLDIYLSAPSDRIVLRDNGVPQGTDPSGIGPIADAIEISLDLALCQTTLLTGDLHVRAVTVNNASDPRLAQAVVDIQTIDVADLADPDTGIPYLSYSIYWQPDSALPSGLYQVEVDGACSGISHNVYNSITGNLIVASDTEV